MSVNCRLIRYDELDKLLDLYKHFQNGDPEVVRDERLASLWDEIYNDRNLHYIVVEVDGEIVSSCTLTIIKNLTRNLKPYGLIENVITHCNYRKRGYGAMVLHKAINICKDNDCYKVMLLTGSKKEETLRFYDEVGFQRGIKTGYIIKL